MDKSGSSPSSKEVVSPLGVSRYGRTRKPKISADFCHIDDALKSEGPPLVLNKSPAKSPKQSDTVQKKFVKTSPDKRAKTKAKPEFEINIGTEVSEDIKKEGLKVLNDVFESAPIDDVLKIIGAAKPSDVHTDAAKKRSPTQLRTYVNKRKIVAPQSRVIESFGLPDDPIVPMYGEKLVFKPFKDLDIDESAPESVTLVDDLIEDILKESSDEFDSDRVELYNGDLNKNKENDRNVYQNTIKNKSPTKTQYNNLNNGLLIDENCKNIGEYEERLKNKQNKESIENIEESLTEIEGGSFNIPKNNLNLDLFEKHNNCNSINTINNQEINLYKAKNIEISYDFQTDHTYVSLEDYNKFIEEKHSISQKKSFENAKETVDDQKVTTNEDQQDNKANENKTVQLQKVEENEAKTISIAKITASTMVPDENDFEEIDKYENENDLKSTKKIIKRNEIAVKIQENYDKINRHSSLRRKSDKDKTVEDIKISKNNAIKENLNIDLFQTGPKVNDNEIDINNVIDERDLEKKDQIKSNELQRQSNEVDEIQENRDEMHQILNKFDPKSNVSETELNPDETPVQTDKIHAEIKEILAGSQNTKEDLQRNESITVKEDLESEELETPETIVKVEDKVELKIEDRKPLLISYAHLEDFENCTSEDDTIPLSRLRTRIKSKAAVDLRSKSPTKKSTKSKKDEVKEDVEVPVEVQIGNVLKTRFSRGRAEVSLIKEIGSKNLGGDAEKARSAKMKSSDKRKVQEVRKLANESVKSPNTKENSPNKGIELEVSAGQLMWAKVGNFPYWPCMVADEPESNAFIKDRNNREFCHVRFFGDKGRRAWIRKKHLLPYCSLAELQKYPNVTRRDIMLQSRKVRYKISWNSAVDEANLLKTKTLEEKLKFFENVLKQQDKEKEEKKLKKEAEGSRTKKEEVVKEEIVEILIPKRVTRNSDNGKSESSPKRKKPNQDDSESDPESEIPLQGFPLSMEEQIALYKRNNLFKKVTKDRVCQICYKLGAVSRCKGRCQGFYHVECAEKNYMKETVNGVKDENKSLIKIDRIDDLINNEIIMSTNEKQVEIISIKDRKRLTPTNLTLTDDIIFKNMPLFEQIDHKMTEVMKDFNDKTLYLESTTDCSLDDTSIENSPMKSKVTKNDEKSDDISVTSEKKIITELFCKNCLENNDPSCFICHRETSKTGSTIRQRCSWLKCGKFFHPECLKNWPQTQWSVTSSKKHRLHSNSNEFVCPMHVCHTCVSDDPRSPISRCYSDKLVRCMYCPSTYHTATYCVPAGTQILSSTQIICSKHENLRRSSKRQPQPINTTWCFICSEGGTLICCETCPTSVHAECLDIKYTDDDKFICEDCETGRFPLYDEIVWVKLGSYRWWPAIILFPNEIPEKVKARDHNPWEFVVKFFGTYDHYWISKGRVFLFQEGDTGGGGATHKRKMEEIFRRSIEEATTVHLLKKEFKESILREAEGKSKTRPPPYVKIKVNRPVGNVRQFDGNISNTTPCECDPKQKNPCGPDSDCLNRLLLTECDPTVCPAGDKCQNQNFEKRSYPDLVPYKTETRGWGLQSLEPLKKGQFVIEYVGEMIDEREYQRRIKQMHELKEENYYFLTIDKDRMIDAGPKGNLARFMNHSCQPNCETQKWTINGDTRVGLFAMDSIPANTELTFNYNLECVGKEKKICKCGAPNCSGFIGLKVRLIAETKTKVKTKKYKKKRSPTPIVQELSEPCFVCGTEGDLRPCDNKVCSNYYHLKCVGLDSWPEGKWICPWHSCTVCMKRTIRCCVKCLNSYCPKHSQGYIRHEKVLGFICSKHDPRKDLPLSPQEIKTEEGEVTSTTADSPEELALPPADPLRINSEVGEIVTSTPYKAEVVRSRRSNNKRKRNGKLSDTKPTSKKRKSKGADASRKSVSGDSSRTLRSATVNSSSDNRKLKAKA